jgi:hypothetical protein
LRAKVDCKKEAAELLSNQKGGKMRQLELMMDYIIHILLSGFAND